MRLGENRGWVWTLTLTCGAVAESEGPQALLRNEEDEENTNFHFPGKTPCPVQAGKTKWEKRVWVKKQRSAPFHSEMFVLFIPVEGKWTHLELMVGYKSNISRHTHAHTHTQTERHTHVQRERVESVKGKMKV